jgi:hypothetical protein
VAGLAAARLLLQVSGQVRHTPARATATGRPLTGPARTGIVD